MHPLTSHFSLTALMKMDGSPNAIRKNCSFGLNENLLRQPLYKNNKLN